MKKRSKKEFGLGLICEVIEAGLEILFEVVLDAVF